MASSDPIGHATSRECPKRQRTWRTSQVTGGGECAQSNIIWSVASGGARASVSYSVFVLGTSYEVFRGCPGHRLALGGDVHGSVVLAGLDLLHLVSPAGEFSMVSVLVRAWAGAIVIRR